MHQLETEDMIPRCAPQPTALGINENVVKPTVPEVSIILNNENQNISGQNATSATQSHQSYANWKKQCLPKVTYPPSIDKEYTLRNANSNVYPMRSAIIKPQTKIHSNIDQQEFRRASETSPMSLFSLENSSTMVSPSYTLTHNYNKRLLDSTQPQIFQQVAPINEVLTICAGTQTISNSGFESKEAVTRQDIDSILKSLQDLRIEQTRIADMCQILLRQQQSPSVFKDTATQCDGTGLIVGVIPQKRPPPIIYDYIEEESTEDHDTYRISRPNQDHHNSPQLKHYHQSEEIATLPKPSTEKSLVMNELVLKYLPKDNISELLQELRMNGEENAELKPVTTASSAKRPEDIEKDSNEISNASYKYLKKYRLLPEDHGVGNYTAGKIRQKQQTPYHMQNELVHQHKSPLALGQHSKVNQENIIDLDVIRRQPKFL